MSIFATTVKRILRNKIQLFFVLVFPLAFMMLGYIGEEPEVKAALIDHDRTPLTGALGEQLRDKASVKTVGEDEIESKLMKLDVDYVLVVPAGFTDRLIAGSGGLGGIASYTVQESNVSEPLAAFVEMWLQHAAAIAQASGHDANAFYTEFERYQESGRLAVQQTALLDRKAVRTLNVLGYLFISMLYTSLVIGLFILVNKNNHTMLRTLAAPVTMRSYMFQTVLGFLFVSIAQVTLVLMMMRGAFGLDLGDSPLSLYALILVFALVSVSFGVLISSLSKNMVQACLIGICLIAPMSMLGGAYFPLDWAPDIIRTIGQFSPVSWIMNGSEKLLLGESLADTGKESIVMLLFAVVFFLVGTMRKADIAK